MPSLHRDRLAFGDTSLTGANQLRRCSGFTMIELLIAVGLSTIILLLVASAFRLVSSTIGIAMRLSSENNLLRAGFIIALDDADFWHSHADPEAPYEKDFMSDRVAAGNGARKRHMAMVRFHRGTDPTAPIVPSSGAASDLADHPLPNPNVYLAHDPRTWYRGYLYPDQRPTSNDSSLPLDSGYDWQSDPGDAEAGWTPRHVYGPYHLCAATDMRFLDNFSATFGLAKSDYVLDAIDVRVNQSRPNCMFKLYQRIGIYGVAAYMPNGTPWVIMDSTGILPNAGSDPVGGQPNHPYQTGNLVDYNWAVNFQKRRLGDLCSAGGMGYNQNQKCYSLKPVANSETASANNNAAIDASSYEEFYVGRVGCDGDNSAEEMAPLLAVIPKTGSTVGNVGDRNLQVQYTSETVRLPWNQSDFQRLSNTNVLDLVNRPKDHPVLRTTILRYQKMAGSDLCVLRSIIENPQTGKRIEVRFATTSTNFRGSRQHWSAVTGGAMGDVYVQ